ncbi:AAA family ATPase [Mycobacteroides abscessus]|uniref:AAA family ATPase n=1 Tax=Mycobacteroides abscessus TaxID=36809 RepID=UPI0003089EA2|nr:AAA family ATPase [Mycobacteroides abscessus]
MTDYQDLFDSALRQWREGNYPAARQGFAAVTAIDPTVSDAWLGLIASGDTSLDTLRSAATNSKLPGSETRRHGWEPGALHANFECPKYVAMPVHSRATIELAIVSALISEGSYQEAAAALAAPEVVAEAPKQWLHFLRVTLMYMAQRWADVLAEYRKPIGVNFADPMVAAAAAVMAGTAAANLGRYQQSLDLLGKVSASCQNQYIVADSELMRGWCERALGNADAAREAFNRATVDGDVVPSAAAALENEALQLPVTSELVIASRKDPWDAASGDDPKEVALRATEHERKAMLAKAEAFMAKQIGLTEVKEEWGRIQDRVLFNQARKADGKAPLMRTNHMVYFGPPGTGKTTVAKSTAASFCGYGILPTDNVLAVRALDLIGKYIGHTEDLTKAAVEKARQGVLIIDEAPALVSRGGENDFGPIVMKTLVPYLEDDRGELVVILMGYEDEMRDLLEVDEGLDSRFPVKLRFPSFNPHELVQIAGVFADEFEVVINAQAEDFFGAACEALVINSYQYAPTKTKPNPRERRMIDHSGNARFVRNVMEASCDRLASRWRAARQAGDTSVDMETLLIADMEAAVSARVRSEFQHVLPMAGTLLDVAPPRALPEAPARVAPPAERPSLGE